MNGSKPDTENAERIARLRIEYSIAARQQELDLFWKRSLFFWGLIASAFVGYASAFGRDPIVGLLLASFGVVCSLAWTLANKGSKYWQENWERKVNESETTVVGPLFSIQGPRQEKGPLSGYRFSVSRLAIGLSDYSLCLWIGLMVLHGLRTFQVHVVSVHPNKQLFVGIAIATAAYCAWLIWWTLPRRAKR